MSVNVKLKDAEGLEDFQKNLRTIMIQLQQFREIKIKEIAEKTLLAKIKERMIGALYPQGVIEGTFISSIDVTDEEFEVNVKSEFIVENGYNLADGFEFGTLPSPGRFVPAIEKRLVDKTRDIGIHPGTKAHNIIKTTVAEFQNIIGIEYKKEEKIWLEENLKVG